MPWLFWTGILLFIYKVYDVIKHVIDRELFWQLKDSVIGEL
jgi:hypothetical protein